MEIKVKQYLEKYSSDIWETDIQLESRYNFIIAVPAIAEHANISFLINSLKNLIVPEKVFPLVLFTINNSDSASEEIRRNNLMTALMLKELRADGEFNFDVAIIDAFSEGKEIPDKYAGAGTARKIGMDLALKFFDYNLSGKKIIAATDADCVIEENYLEEIYEFFNKNNSSAAVVNFEHRISKDEYVTKAIINYELFLRYYALGLKYAGSDYAYHSIGSTMVCDYEAYIKCGGMNKRKAGEDFYFLQKLAKITKIRKIIGTTVYPSPRPSRRVPFGTGQRVTRYLSGQKDEYLLYNPDIFSVLKNWLTLYFSGKNKKAGQILEEAGNIYPALRAFLIERKFEFVWEKIKANSPSEKQFERQLSFWFDGFKTMKLIHYLRDNQLGEIQSFDAIEKLLKMNNIFIIKNSFKGRIPPIDIQLEYLSLLRELA